MSCSQSYDSTGPQRRQNFPTENVKYFPQHQKEKQRLESSTSSGSPWITQLRVVFIFK